MSSTTQIQINRNTATASNLETILIDLNIKASSITQFDRVFIEAVESVLSRLGNANKQALYLHLENHFGLRKEAIPQNIEFFKNALEYLFGESALLLEIQIMETLYHKVPAVRYAPKNGVLSFISYVENIRRHCTNS